MILPAYTFFSVLLACLFLVGGGVAHAQCPKVDSGHDVYPSGVYPGGVVVFRHSSNQDYPMDVLLYRKKGTCDGARFDRYSVNGSSPKIDYVFSHEYRGKSLLFVIVSWKINSRGAGVYGKLYQVYAYGKDGKGGLEASSDIASRDDMTGIEGTDQNMPSHFYGKDPAELVKLLDSTSGQ